MTEAADGGIVISSYATHNKIFRELIPAGKTNCYYVRNTATGRYIGSSTCSQFQSKVRMSDTPVEYYINQIIIDFRRQQRLLVDVVDRLLWI